METVLEQSNGKPEKIQYLLPNGCDLCYRGTQEHRRWMDLQGQGRRLTQGAVLLD